MGQGNLDAPKKRGKRLAWGLLLFVAVGIGAYYINVEVQSALGRRALESTGLDPLSLEEASAFARSDGKLVLADLSAIWCPTCRNLDKKVLADKKVRQLIDSGFVFARIDYESAEGKKFMETYGARSFPTVLVLQPNGDLVSKVSLTFQPDHFSESLREAQRLASR